MADWMTWLVWAGVAVIFELFTGTFYLLMVAIGLLAGALVSWLGAGEVTQALAAAIVGGAATWLLRRFRKDRPHIDIVADPDVNLDVGQSIKVDTWDGSRARVMYRGALWDVELAPGAVAQPGSFRIAEVRGSRLILANS